ncbi:hypothetical protein [Planctomyces sp. SH-PL14]|uniref:hypothetical protein n=1 Tax=Planctomyces sp. SH-PL14 TaxID=1632864 RepID=UPI0012E87B98|nr:hypothetical protein [Planctomyces sp. SH-PL14]
MILIGLVTACGCHSEPSEAQSTREFVAIQAEQNRRLADLQSQLQSQQTTLNQQRDALETERRELAAKRLRDPVIAEAITAIGTLLACLAPILLTWVVLGRGNQELDAELIADALIADLASGGKSVLLPALQPQPAASRLQVNPHLPSLKESH